MMTREERKAHIAALCRGTSGLIYKKKDLSQTRSSHGNVRVIPGPGAGSKSVEEAVRDHIIASKKTAGREVEKLIRNSADSGAKKIPSDDENRASWSVLSHWHDSVIFLTDSNKRWILYSAEMPVYKITFMRGNTVLGYGRPYIQRYQGRDHLVASMPIDTTHVVAQDQDTFLSIQRAISHVKYIS